ncbi:MAG TPA: M48 family metallopeptidase, partial [Humisphaera sp.]
MSRLLLLFICLTWMAGVSEPSVRGTVGDARSIGEFLGAMPAVVLLAAAWSRLIARRVAGHNAGRCARRLGWVMIACRLFVVGWFAAGVFSLGWPHFVLTTLGAGRVESLRLPGLVIGTLPVLLAWVGLWWAQIPADQALRLQGQMDNLDDGLPVHRPPGRWASLASNVRLQVLFTVMPVMLIVAVQDATSLALRPLFDWRFAVADGAPEPASVTALRGQVEAVLWLVAAGVVFVIAPEVLRRILQTSPLADSPLRRRLEALSRRSGIRCRDILVWRTHFNVGNAAVMGLLPRFRYVLLSDLLLERLSDEEIEAVFAHEVGHVVHRHMAWYVVFFLILMLLAVGPGTLVADALKQTAVAEQYQPVLLLAASAGAIWLVFGFLSRRFERQADVYAARVMEAVRPPAGAAAAGAAALA